MKKILMITGIVFLGLFITASAYIGYIYVSSSGLDKSSKEYVDESIIQITTNWSKEALISRFSRELINATDLDSLDNFFNKFKSLGELVKYKGSSGEAKIRFSNILSKTITAEYVAFAVYKNGNARFDIVLIHEDGQWYLQRFHIESQNLFK
jgi:hypothetical protein